MSLPKVLTPQSLHAAGLVTSYLSLRPDEVLLAVQSAVEESGGDTENSTREIAVPKRRKPNHQPHSPPSPRSPQRANTNSPNLPLSPRRPSSLGSPKSQKLPMPPANIKDLPRFYIKPEAPGKAGRRRSLTQPPDLPMLASDSPDAEIDLANLDLPQQVLDLFSSCPPEGVPVPMMTPLTVHLGFPKFLNSSVARHILLSHGTDTQRDLLLNNPPPADVNTDVILGCAVSLEAFTSYYRDVLPLSLAHRYHPLLAHPCPNITRTTLLPHVRLLLATHPGLDFLRDHSEFQDKYAATVITRIFYSLDTTHSGLITLRQLSRSDLTPALLHVDSTDDINKAPRYFSYEHFYVLYCRFWELDTDRDYRLTRADLLKYAEHSLSHAIVDRIFSVGPRPFGRASEDEMTYEDFIYFMLSEEDKSNMTSVQYWFTCLDIDGDGVLTSADLKGFYAVQMHRMRCLGHEVVPFEDVMCQMSDMIKPESQGRLSPPDFTKPECGGVSGALFDAMFNLNKYLQFESRDPFLERQKREDEFDTDWDRYACIDYNRLAMEEEAREEEGQMEMEWQSEDVSLGEGGGGGAAMETL